MKYEVGSRMMENRFILSPFFLDEPLPELRVLAAGDWVVNSPALPGGDQGARMSAIQRPLADYVAESVMGGDRPVSIAGDCCAAIGVLAGLQRAGVEPTLIWFDAHGDFNTWETTPSGFLGGMPLAMLVGRGEQAMPAAVGLETLPEASVFLTDARDLDPAERQALLESEVVHLTDVGDLKEYPLPGGPLYVHFDVDVVTPDEAPAQNYPAPGGPSFSVLEAVLGRLARSGQVVAVSLSAWNPRLDEDGASQEVCMSLLETLVGGET
jgi:arginase